MNIWPLVGILVFVLIAIQACFASYNNGVTDGYGYAKEPENPGYQKAGRYLKKYMPHRWSELKGGSL